MREDGLDATFCAWSSRVSLEWNVCLASGASTSMFEKTSVLLPKMVFEKRRGFACHSWRADPTPTNGRYSSAAGARPACKEGLKAEGHISGSSLKSRGK